MKLFKLNVNGSSDNFNIKYTAASNFITYEDCGFNGSEQEKYNLFLKELEKNGGPQPVNIKVKLNTQTVDRALSKNEILSIKDVNEFIKRLSR
ncbi:hypothetical protein SAMN05428976_1147 [Clostridium sp. USBA 49]|jgi:hypothetical protein|uniref:hypothetical protein n=1 Tax=Clostridium TaxID=1485 RepID=UPI000999F448|nr:MULTISPECIES: hypothetical protein [Clostridium]SKA90135.1 hypothetical protein SAMN05428976_1147 [Clostridium sp. USBA 49]